MAAETKEHHMPERKIAVPVTPPAFVEEDFRRWMASVSRSCQRTWGVRLDDLPDMQTRAAFDAGVTPDEFFEDEVVALMREDFAELSGLDQED